MTRHRSLLVAVLACVMAAPAAAHAAFPGKNGPFVLAIADDCQSFERYLARLSPRGGALVPLTERCDPTKDYEDQPPGFAHPDAAADGSFLMAFRGGFAQGFVTLRPDGTALAPVPLPAEAATPTTMSGPSLAPNGRKFAFEADRYEGGYDREPLWEAQLDGSSARRIRRAAACRRGESCRTFENPRWSPDGKLIAVEVADYRSRRRSGIWLIRARDGKPVRQLTKHGVDVDWSPDGRNIVYRTHYEQQEIGGGATGGNLYVVSRDGERRRKLVHRHGIAETQPTWSPNGRWIAWVSMDFSGGDVGFDVFPSLWVVRATGGKPRKIQDLPEPYVEEGDFAAPHLTWLPAAA